METKNKLLEVKDLSIHYFTDEGAVSYTHLNFSLRSAAPETLTDPAKTPSLQRHRPKTPSISTYEVKA